MKIIITGIAGLLLGTGIFSCKKDIVEVDRACKQIPGTISIEGLTQSIEFNIPSERRFCQCDTLILRFSNRTNINSAEWTPQVTTDSLTGNYLITKSGTYSLRVELRFPSGVHSRDSLTVNFKDCI